MRLPTAVDIAQPSGEQATRTLKWEVQHGTILRLHQLLAQVGYLPVDWDGAADPVARTPSAQLAAVADPPAGHFSWPYPHSTPKELRGIWRTFAWNEITRGAVMMFEHDHGLEVDAFVGPKVWHALLSRRARREASHRRLQLRLRASQRAAAADALARRQDDSHLTGKHGRPRRADPARDLPGLRAHPDRHDGRHKPGRIHYNDPGIRWISYFNHGEALHAFNRSSFGTPQSLGCVELPLAAAAKVYPYTPIGTLVTVEN